MSGRRALVVGCLVTLAVLLQVSVINPMHLPGGGPVLVVLVVAVVAMAEGPTVGMLVGFAGGLLADLTPPADHPIGQSVFVLVVAGEVVGLLHRRGSSLLRAVALVGLATLLAGLGTAGLGFVLGHPLGVAGAAGGVLAATAYNVALAPALLLLAGGAPERAGERRTRAAGGRGAWSPTAIAPRRRRSRRAGRSATAGGLR